MAADQRLHGRTIVVTGATLKLEATAVGGSLTIETYQLLESWAEGSTTWNSWGTPGGTFTRSR